MWNDDTEVYQDREESADARLGLFMIKAEAGPECVDMMRILDEDKNHHPLNQVLHRALVAAKPSLKYVLRQSANELLFEFGKQQQECLPYSVFHPMLQGVTIVTDFRL